MPAAVAGHAEPGLVVSGLVTSALLPDRLILVGPVNVQLPAAMPMLEGSDRPAKGLEDTVPEPEVGLPPRIGKER